MTWSHLSALGKVEPQEIGYLASLLSGERRVDHLSELSGRF